MSNYYYCYLHVDVGDTTVLVMALVMVVVAMAVMMAVMVVIIISFIRSHYKCKADDDVSLTLSPVIVGSVLTIVIISLAVALKIFMMTFLHNLRRNRQHGTKATATAVVTQTGDVYKVRFATSSNCYVNIFFLFFFCNIFVLFLQFFSFLEFAIIRVVLVLKNQDGNILILNQSHQKT